MIVISTQYINLIYVIERVLILAVGSVASYAGYDIRGDIAILVIPVFHTCPSTVNFTSFARFIEAYFIKADRCGCVTKLGYVLHYSMLRSLFLEGVQLLNKLESFPGMITCVSRVFGVRVGVVFRSMFTLDRWKDRNQMVAQTGSTCHAQSVA